MITLMRHGKVQPEGVGKMPVSGLRQAVADYDDAPVFPPDQETVEGEGEARILCSDLRRSHESALLAFGRFHETNRCFREADLPDLPNLSIRVSPSVLIGAARILWFLGRSKGCESFWQFRARCVAAAEMLIERELAEGHVVLVGHALLNRYIAKALLNRGYDGPRKPSPKHWAQSHYRRELP